MLQKYLFKSGIDKENTRYTNEGKWWSMDNMRFRSGTPEKIGGWQNYSPNTYLGVNRILFNWVDLDQDNIMVLGTNIKLYNERGGTISDITPIVATQTTANSLTSGATAGSKTVTVAYTSHGHYVGDYFIISGASGFDGIPAGDLNGEHVITSVPNNNTFTFEVATGCTTGGVTGGGAAVTVDLLLSNGAAYASGGYGWGAGPWGSGVWGEGGGSAGFTDNIRLWSCDNFGENLLANPRGGEIYYWEPALGYDSTNRAYPISEMVGASATPLKCNTVLASDERHVIAFGVNTLGDTVLDPLLIRWSDQEDPAMWTPTATNSAGDMRVPLGSYIVTARQTRQEILVWTDTSLHSLQYIGAPYVFSLQTLADNASLISPNAAITVNNVTYWMGKDKFYTYSGRVETLPCSLRRYVFNDLDFSQASQVNVGVNEQFGEVIWFYCTKGSYVIDRCVIFNYLENIWYYGSLSRTAWLDSHLRGKPFATNNGLLYVQETGLNAVDNFYGDDPEPIVAYIESADFDIDDGQKFTFIQRVIPDIDFEGSTSDTPGVTYTLKARNFPGSDFTQQDDRGVSKTVAMSIDEYTNQVWVRLRGRQAALRVESTELGVQWQLGSTRLDIRPDGRR